MKNSMNNNMNDNMDNENMKNDTMKRTTILTTIVCLIPVLIGAILYPNLPDMIATHWDMNGVANGWQPKFVGAIVFPGILVLVNLIFPVLLKLDPKYKNTDNKVKSLLHWIIPIVSMFASGTTLASALGHDTKIGVLGPMVMGLIFVVIGNYLPKMSQSYTVGIKLPWTLNSEENWNRTHRMAGFIWVIGGILLIILGVIGIRNYLMLVIAAALVLVPTIYSIVLYKKGI